MHEEVEELTALRDLQIERMDEALALWHRERPMSGGTVTPDLGALIGWLIERGNR